MRGRTVVPWESVRCGAEVLGEDLARALRAVAWLVGVVVHERDLLRGLVCRVKVVLDNTVLARLERSVDTVVGSAPGRR